MATGIFFADEFIPVMEDAFFREPGPDTVFDQFVMELDDFSMKPGDTKRVLGPTFLAEPSNPYTDRKLSSISDKVSDNPSQHPDLNKQEIALEEHLLPNALIAQEFEAAHSYHDLAQMNGAVLARDYHRWRDAYIRNRMLDSTFVRYVGGVANEAALTSAAKITSDEIMITATKLAQRYVPTYPDGNYIAVVDDATITTLYTEQKFLDATTRALAANAPVFRGEMCVVGGVRFIRTNNMPTTTGDSDGTPFAASQVLIFGTSTFGMWPMGTADGLVSAERIAFMNGMGAGPVVALRGKPVSVRLREVNDYGRFQEMIWLEHSMYKVLDPGVTVYDGTKTIGTDSRFIQKLVGSTVMV